MSKRDLKALVWKEEKLFVAKAIGIELASQGKTKKEALTNLAEAMDLLLEDEDVKISNFSIPENPQVTSLYA